MAPTLAACDGQSRFSRLEATTFAPGFNGPSGPTCRRRVLRLRAGAALPNAPAEFRETVLPRDRCAPVAHDQGRVRLADASAVVPVLPEVPAQGGQDRERDHDRSDDDECDRLVAGGGEDVERGLSHEVEVEPAIRCRDGRAERRRSQARARSSRRRAPRPATERASGCRG